MWIDENEGAAIREGKAWAEGSESQPSPSDGEGERPIDTFDMLRSKETIQTRQWD